MLRAATNNLNEIDLNAPLTKMDMASPSAGRWRMSASAQIQSCLPKDLAQAHPPAAVGHPFPALWQHHSFLGIDHPAIQFANPALQSYGAEVVPTGAHPPAC